MTSENENALVCPFCQRSSVYGVKVCIHCNATVIYGATTPELNRGMKEGFCLGALFSLLFFVFMPEQIANWLNIEKMPPFFGLGVYALFAALVIACIAGFKMQSLVEKQHEGKVRFCR